MLYGIFSDVNEHFNLPDELIVNYFDRSDNNMVHAYAVA